MPDPARQRFWNATRRWTFGLLAAWALLSVAVPWYAPSLDSWTWMGFPLGWWMGAEGALLGFLVIVLVYAVVMDKLEARLRAELAAQGPDVRQDMSAAAPLEAGLAAPAPPADTAKR